MKLIFFLILFSSAAFGQEIKYLKVNFHIETDFGATFYHIGDSITKIDIWQYESKGNKFYLPDESVSDIAILTPPVKVAPKQTPIPKPPTTQIGSSPAPKSNLVKVPFDNPLDKKAYNR